jgi:hypothetical protein
MKKIKYGFTTFVTNIKTWYYRLTDETTSNRSYITIKGKRVIRQIWWENLSKDSIFY